MTGRKSARSTTPAYASLRIMSGGPTAVKPLSERKSTAYLIIDCSSLRASPFRKKNRAPETLAALSMSMRPRSPKRSRWSFGVKSNVLGSPQVLTVTLPLSSDPTGTDSWRMFGSDIKISLTRAWRLLRPLLQARNLRGGPLHLCELVSRVPPCPLQRGDLRSEVVLGVPEVVDPLLRLPPFCVGVHRLVHEVELVEPTALLEVIPYCVWVLA